MRKPEVVEPPDPYLEVVSRAEWGAREPSGPINPIRWPFFCTLWTYAQTEPCHTKEECCSRLRSLQDRHMTELGMADIQYNFYIGADLRIYEGRGWTKMNADLYHGWLPGERLSVGVAYLGRYDNQNYPNKEVLKRQLQLVHYALQKRMLCGDYRKLLVTENIDY